MNGRPFGLARSIDGPDGYSTALTLQDDELELIRKLVRIQWLYRLQLLDPQHIAEFDERGMERYHELAHLIDHSNAWPKVARILPADAVHLLLQLPFFRKLESELGSFEISDDGLFGWPYIYWRLVRPGTEDIGPIHSDKWFWDLGLGNMPDYPCRRVKVWIALLTEPGKNGLLVCPGSHQKDDWKWHSEERHGMQKPVFDEDLDTLDIRLIETPPGQAVVFHDNLLHGGAQNNGENCRVSIEFTLLVRE